MSKNTWHAKINTDKHFVEMSVSKCYELSDNRLAFIAVFALTCGCICSKQEVCEKESLSREIFQTTRKLPSIPPRVDDFPTVSRASYLSDTLDKLHVRTVPTVIRMTRNFLYGNQLSFDRCNGARACLCAWMTTLDTEYFPSHVSITVWRCSANMMIYWRRIRLIHRRRKFVYDFSCEFVRCLIFINRRYQTKCWFFPSEK